MIDQTSSSTSSNKINSVNGEFVHNDQPETITEHCSTNSTTPFALINSINPTNTNQPVPLMYVKETKYFDKTLIDSGSQVSVAPKSLKSLTGLSIKPSSLILYGANGLPVDSSGRIVLIIDLGLNKDFKFSFILAEVPHAILGLDFLTKFKLVPIPHSRVLLDATTNQQVQCVSTNESSLKLFTIQATNSQEQQILDQLISEFPDVFNQEKLFDPSTVKHHVKHYIRTTGEPFKSKVRPLNPDLYNIAKKEFDELLKLGIVQRAESPWSSPLTMVKKKNGQWRPCSDYRRFNKMTQPDNYAIPFLQDVSNNLAGSKFFSTIDLYKAYHQIPVNESDVPKTAVCTPFGNFVYKFLGFGLRTATQSFQRMMDEIISSLNFQFTYIDDMLAHSSTLDKHYDDLRQLFKILQTNGLIINSTKSKFAQNVL